MDKNKYKHLPATGLDKAIANQLKTKTSLFTVPHTGTHFAIEFLKCLGIEHASGTGFFSIHPKRTRITDWENGGWFTIANTNCVVTARDPYLTHIRYIHNNHDVSDNVKSWDCMINALPHLRSYKILDIGCRVEDRYDHLCEIAEFVGVYPKAYRELIEVYADAWMPLNDSENEIKKQYLETNSLPTTQTLELPSGDTKENEIDWSELDFAIDWYKTLPTNDFGDK